MPKENITSQQERLSQKTLLPKELKDAIKLVNTLLLTWKNYSLYPEEHVTSKNAIAKLVSEFGVFLNIYGNLRLTIEKNRLLLNSDLLHEASSDSPSENIISLLYRDGIQWLEFQNGLTVDELRTFFKTVNNYKILIEETEGDIVTSLIDADLEHIQFKAIDYFWQDFPLIDFSKLNPLMPEPAETAEPVYEIESDDSSQEIQGSMNDHIKSITDPSFKEALWKISSGEYEKLQHMVLEEENWNNTEDVFDVLLIILGSQAERENFATVLDFTLEEVVATIEQEEFGLLLNLFQMLHKLLQKDEFVDAPWSRLLIERFFQDLSNPEIFSLITENLLRLNEKDTEKIKCLRQVLLYFSPAVILPLGQVITQIKCQEVREMLMQVMEYLCYRDITPLEKLLDDQSNIIGEKFLPILRHLDEKRTDTIYFRMIEHPSRKMRLEAATVLVSRNPKFIQRLFPLIEDPSEDVRSCVLSAIGKHKSTALENMLIKYLRENSDKKDPPHILACYEALGCCGSLFTVPFLRRILLDSGWNRFKGFGKLLHREGAATALALIDTDETKDILLAAANNRFGVIREAFQNAMAKIDTAGETPND